MKIIKKLLGLHVNNGKKNDFSAFFRDAKADEKKKTLLKIIRKSNEEQRNIIKKYNQLSKVS